MKAAHVAGDDKSNLPERLAAIRLLGYGPFESAQTALSGLLTPQQAQEVQLAAVRALSVHNQPAVAPASSPGVVKLWARRAP